MKIHLLPTLLLFAMSCTYAQNKAIDSLQKVLVRQKEDTNKVNTLLRLVGEYRLANFNTAKMLEYAEPALELAEKIGFGRGKGEAYRQLAVVNFTTNPELSLKQRQLSLQCYEAVNDKVQAAYSVIYIGNWYNRRGNYSEGFRYHSQALSQFEALKDNKGIAEANCEIGYSFFQQKNYPEAIRSYLQGANYYVMLKDRTSAANIYKELSELLSSQANYSEAARYAYQASKIYDELGDERNKAGCFTIVGDADCFQGNYSESVWYAYQALKIYEKLGDVRGKADCFRIISGAYISQDNYSQALSPSLEACELYEKTQDMVYIGNSYATVGTVYLRQKKYNVALKNFQRALQIASEVKGSSWLYPYVQLCTGEYYEVTALLAATSGDTVAASEKYKQASYYYSQTLKAWRAEDIKQGQGDAYRAFGKMYIKQKKYDLARLYLDSALIMYKESGHLPKAGQIHESISQLDNLKGNYQQALYHYKVYRSYCDSTLGASSQSEIMRMKMQYESDKKEDSLKTQQLLTDEKLKEQQLLAVQQLQRIQIDEASLKLSNQQKELNRLSYLEAHAQLQNEQSQRQQKEKQLALAEQEMALQLANLKANKAQLQLKQKEVEARSRERSLIFIGSFVCLLLGIAFWRSNSQKQKAYNLLEKQNLRTVISSDLHDEVGSALSAISIFSEMAKQSNHDARQEQKYLQRIGDRSRESIEKMGDIIWSINPENDNLQQILLRMKTYASEVAEAKNTAVHWTESESITRINLNMMERKNFYLLFKEGFNNAIKYSCAKNIYVDLNAAQNNISLRIKDDGVGFDVANTPAGNGLKTMQRRADLLGGQLKIMSGPGSGTTILFSFVR